MNHPVGRKNGEGNLLTVLGAINWDIIVFEDRFAEQGEEVAVNRVEEFSGGKGANVAVAAARVLGAGRVAFVGALGDDELAEKQVVELESEHVLTEAILRIKGFQSGRAYILVDGLGKKTIHTHFGANERITPEDLGKRKVARVIELSKMVVIMDPPIEVANAAVEIAKRRGATVISSPGVRTQEGMARLASWIKRTDYLVLDRIELKNLSSGVDEESFVQTLATEYPGLTLIVTLGERGCRIAAGGETRAREGVELELLKKKPVNTTGCGDAFLGVLASYLLQGETLLEAAEWANLAGGIKATRYETRGSPRRIDLQRAMAALHRLRQTQLGLPTSRAV